ncbi:MAG TPA: hypothetical protein VJ438_05745 [Candidatus Nanoarchaeia archaeon]|nr:hypothetical protein [Candidatus Nanoarchaeia archaeon]
MTLTSKIKNYVKENKKSLVISAAGTMLSIFLLCEGMTKSMELRKEAHSKLVKPIMNESIQELHDSEINFRSEISKILNTSYNLRDPNLFSGLEESISSLKSQYSNEENLRGLEKYRQDLKTYEHDSSMIDDITIMDSVYLGIPLGGLIVSMLYSGVGIGKKKKI